MKKLAIIFALIICLGLVSSLDITTNSNYSKGETFIAKISGNFINPILKEDISFYRGHVSTGIEPFVAKINNAFYIYALLPENSGNYSLKIRNAKYQQGTQIVEEDIEKNFTITESLADFTLSKGFIFEEEEFSIRIQNLQDKPITIESKTNAETNSYSLESGEIKTLNFKVDRAASSIFQLISFSSSNTKYSIPVYLSPKEVVVNPVEEKLKFDPPSINVSMILGFNTSRKIYLLNYGESNVYNISIKASEILKPFVSFSISLIEELKENSSVKIELIFSSNLTKEKIVEGYLTALTPNKTYSYFPVYLNIIKNFSSISNGDYKTCLEVSAGKCLSAEICNGEEIKTEEGTCCLGVCTSSGSGGNSTGKIIGWVMAIVIVGFLGWFFFKKYRGTKHSPIDLLKIGKKE